jgi:hypothetical protein
MKKKASSNHCSSCGKHLSEHLNLDETCEELIQSQAATKALSVIYRQMELYAQKMRHQRDCARNELKALTNQLTRGK